MTPPSREVTQIDRTWPWWAVAVILGLFAALALALGTDLRFLERHLELDLARLELDDRADRSAAGPEP